VRRHRFISMLIRNPGLDKFRQQGERFLPAEIAGLGRNDIGHPFLDDVQLGPHGDLWGTPSPTESPWGHIKGARCSRCKRCRPAMSPPAILRQSSGNQVGNVAGFSLHAGVAARADERKKLERLCRYISRPAVAEKRLSLTPNSNVRYQLKTPYRDGTTHAIF